LSRSAGDRKQEATSLRRMGIIYLELGQYAQAEKLQREALSLHQALGDRIEECHALAQIAETLSQQGCFEQAEELERQSLKNAMAIQYYGGISRVVGMLYELYRHRGQLQAALQFIDEQISHFSREDSKLLTLNLQAIKCDLLASLGQYEQSLEIGKPLIEFLGSLDSEKTWADINTFYAHLLMNLGRLDASQAILDQALPKAERSGIPVILADTLVAYGELSLRLGDPKALQSGLEKVLQALELLDSTANKQRKVLAFSLAARLYRSLGQAEQALAASSQGIALAETLASADQSEIYFFVHALALYDAGQLESARVALRRAYERLRLVADQLQDENLQQSWLESVTINRDILLAWQEWGLEKV